MRYERTISIQRAVFERLDRISTRHMDGQSYRVYIPENWIEVLLKQSVDPDYILFFRIDGRGKDVGDYGIETFIDITLLEGGIEFKAMVDL